MKNYTSFLLFVLLTFISSCSYIKNVGLLSGGELKAKNFVQEVPFELKKDLIVVKVKLNADTVLREFIFDTGAFNSKVENNLATGLGLETVTTKSNSTAQGVTKEIEVTRLDSITFGETAFYKIGAGKVVYSEKSASPCIAKHGLIGANLMKLAHWKINYQNQKLYFSDTPFSMEGEYYSLPFESPVLSGTPKINLKIGEKTVENVLFDVGFNGGLVLPLSLAHHFESEETEIILDKSTSGIYGSNEDSLIVKKLKVELGGYKTEILVEFSKLGKALIGNEFLKHFTICIDYEEDKILLQPQKEVKIEAPTKFLLGMLNESLWVVNRTNSKLDLQLGDTVLSVNNHKPKDLFSSHCDYIINAKKMFEADTLVLEMKNGDKIELKDYKK
ncbi:pepsin/retropepsin-like aspartic protease family protein [Bernardetia sp. ABR2-2B]|uniref:pepsin/retropepsin-like aspartic protease family protein n=1 Tax=Bernardetia sp. ABR2-2B TaxID=3127472 RepID=UPI0030CF2F3E